MADRSRLRWRALQALQALVDEASVTRAAERLRLSQPATSALLAELRQLFDDPLLVRQGRIQVPTARALELRRDIGQVLEQVDRLFARAATLDPATIRRTVTLAVADPAGLALVPPLVSRLAQVAPGLRLRVLAATAEEPAHALAHGPIDLLVSHHVPRGGELRASVLSRAPMVAVLRGHHPALRRRLSLAGWLRLPHVVVVPHAPEVESALRRASVRARTPPLQVLVSVQHLSAAAAIVARTDATALMAGPTADAYGAAFGLRVWPPPRSLGLPPVETRALWHERSHHDRELAWLREQLRSVASRA